MSGCGTRIVLRGQKPLALCDRCPCFGSLYPPLAALTFAASSIIYAFGLASAAPRSPYRHLELCGIAIKKKMITFSLVSGGTSVAALFMAGYLTGILWGLACMIVIYFFAKKHGYRSKTSFTFKEAIHTILQAIPALLLSLFGYKSIKLKEIPKILRESAEMTGIIIFLIGVSSIMSWVMAFTNIPSLVSSALLSISSNRYVILFLINIILLVVGTFMDMTPACLIFTPIFLPVCQALGMNTIHFGIMLIFNLCIGTITPPVGTTLFVGVKVGGVKIETVFKQLIAYFAAIFAVLMLVTYVPQISLALPSLMGYVK